MLILRTSASFALTFALERVDRAGRMLSSIVIYTIEVLAMTYLSARAAFFDQAQGLRAIVRVISAQIYFTGWEAMPLVTVLALACGGIVVMQAFRRPAAKVACQSGGMVRSSAVRMAWRGRSRNLRPRESGTDCGRTGSGPSFDTAQAAVCSGQSWKNSRRAAVGSTLNDSRSSAR
jgi:hypothetical protein